MTLSVIMVIMESRNMLNSLCLGHVGLLYLLWDYYGM